MAKSTPIVLTAGGISAVDLILRDDTQPAAYVRVIVGTVGAALLSAGLDKVVPGFGTGAAILLCAAVILTSGPNIAKKIN